MSLHSTKLNENQLNSLEKELNELRESIVNDLGEKDANYIRKILSIVRYTDIAGRIFLFFSWFPIVWVLGVLCLSLSKILENMEVGHNIIHGQYDWMNDEKLNGQKYEWDMVGTSENWRYTHNYIHHTYTNIKDKDHDIGYGLIRIFPEQQWNFTYLFQIFYTVFLALFFQWGVALQRLDLISIFNGKKSKKEWMEELKPLSKKIGKQTFKDYIFFPLLSGPFFFNVFLGNLVANGIRNIWTFLIIFCGHFTKNAQIFDESVLENESKGHWYYRQICGSSNIKGGKLFHILSGNLSYQIEHHLYPDIPAYRYLEMAPKVKEICKKYAIPYNTGSLSKQFSQVVFRILKYSFPFENKILIKI